ncbi:MAG: peptidoglycan-binding protein [bacterium]|nr:peptidoglycan-binding protein [bacterium]
MKRLFFKHKNLIVRLGTTYLALAIFFVAVPVTVSAAVTADIKAEGSDGPVNVTNGNSFSFSWTSTDATACQLTSPSGVSGTSVSGSDGPIAPGHPWYPAVGGSTTLTLDCTDGTVSTGDFVVINIVATDGGSVTADIKANDSDGPVTITNGTSWNYSWTSTGATACQLTSPSGVSGISLSGSDGPIAPGHPWYPATSTPTTLTLDCTNGTVTTQNSVVINITGLAPSAVTADIKANDSDGPVTITNGTSWNYSWTSTGATACQLTSPSGVSGISLSGNDGPIAPGHSWYPATSTPTTLTLNCTNGTVNATDSVVINITGLVPSAVTADIKANGSDGPVTVVNGTAWNYSWTSTGATACQLTSPSGVSGISLSGSDGPIAPGHPWYPAVGGSTTLTLDCTNGSVTTQDAVIINVVTLVPPPGPGPGGGGGGGGRSGGSSRPPTPTPQVLGATTIGNFCPFLTSYLRMGANNDTLQVIKLQAFLKSFEGYDYVTINGVFDQATFQAVSAFQLKYKSEILTPWGINAPTGYVYKLTLAKINQIICGSPMPAVQGVYHAPVVIKDKVPTCTCPADKEMGGYKEGAGTSTLSSIPIIGQNISKGQNIDTPDTGYPSSIAGALFSWPDTAAETMQCLYELLLIIIVLYIIGSVLEGVLYKDLPENISKRFFVKWGAIAVGFVLALVGAYLLQEWCLLLPLIIALLATGVYMILSTPKDQTVRTIVTTKTVTTEAKS